MVKIFCNEGVVFLEKDESIAIIDQSGTLLTMLKLFTGGTVVMLYIVHS